MRLHNDAKVDLISRVPLLASCSKKELRSTVSVSRAGERINDLTAGEWVGEIAALVASVPRTATVVTTSPVRALVLTRGGFLRLIEDNPSIAAKVLALLGERVAPEAI